ncbi:MAG: heavy-metal-associated domain-containing protein [Pararhodobacter sp.]
MAQTLILSVPDMSCGHCRASIDKALIPMGVQTAFDMERRQLAVTGDATQQSVREALDRIGFPAEPV